MNHYKFRNAKNAAKSSLNQKSLSELQKRRSDYKIFKHPGVNRRLFTLALGIVFAPFVYIGCLMIAEGLNLMVLVVFIAMLPFFALLIVRHVYFIIYYGLSFALLIVGYYLSEGEKPANRLLLIENKFRLRAASIRDHESRQ